MKTYIEREATLWHKRVMIGSDWSGEYSAEAVLVEDINKLPAADVAEVVHGRWIYKGASVDGKRVYECSACHNDIYATGPYCKECGCKMDKEDET